VTGEPVAPAHARKARGSPLQVFFQVLAILLLVGIFAVLLHKGWSDVSALARANGREEFWPALLRYVFRNLAGG
jgi:hypothetical protein